MPGETDRLLERAITRTRTFDAPRELVFRMWTESAHLARWWGPKGFTNPVCEADARPGGALRIVMRAPDGTEYPMRGEFREVVPPERLVVTNFAVDAEDRPILDGLTTVSFSEAGGKTMIVVETRAAGIARIVAGMLDGMEIGWSQSLDRLQDYVDARR